MASALKKEDLEIIGGYVKDHLPIWLNETDLGRSPTSPVYTLELRDRMIQNEGTLKALIEQIDKRFEAQQREMNMRFEQVDKRFEQVDKRFEQVDKRFEQVDQRLNHIDRKIDMQNKWFTRLFIATISISLAGISIILAAIRWM